MSLATATIAPIQPEREAPRPERHLRPVEKPARVRKPRVAYALTALIGAVLIGAAQMGLSIATTATTYDIRTLTGEQRDLSLQAQSLNQEIAGLASPQYLAANATAMGMVIGASPTYLRLSDGAVIGTGEVASASTIDPLKTPAVGNALIANTPLTTAPGQTIGGAMPVAAPAVIADAPVIADEAVPVVEPEPQLPPVISEGLPTPETH